MDRTIPEERIKRCESYIEVVPEATIEEIEAFLFREMSNEIAAKLIEFKKYKEVPAAIPGNRRYRIAIEVIVPK